MASQPRCATEFGEIVAVLAGKTASKNWDRPRQDAVADGADADAVALAAAIAARKDDTDCAEAYQRMCAALQQRCDDAPA